ncbi:hypothetical protein V8F20_004120 [Naviculisporaceae sp. PSN 640]
MVGWHPFWKDARFEDETWVEETFGTAPSQVNGPPLTFKDGDFNALIGRDPQPWPKKTPWKASKDENGGGRADEDDPGEDRPAPTPEKKGNGSIVELESASEDCLKVKAMINPQYAAIQTSTMSGATVHLPRPSKTTNVAMVFHSGFCKASAMILAPSTQSESALHGGQGVGVGQSGGEVKDTTATLGVATETVVLVTRVRTVEVVVTVTGLHALESLTYCSLAPVPYAYLNHITLRSYSRWGRVAGTGRSSFKML